MARADLARWIGDNTDVPVSKVAIAEPDRIYSVERLGDRAPTGEVIALVRAEGLKANWIGQQGYRSWDSHVIFDCSGDRMRVIRSASYPQPNRQGAPRAETRDQDWFTPRTDEVGAKLLAAACEDSFAWPLRTGLDIAAVEPPAQVAPAVERASPPADPPLAVAPMLVALKGGKLASAKTDAPATVVETGRRSERASLPAAAGERRFAALFSPFARAAALTGRLFADGGRTLHAAMGPVRRPAMQHAALAVTASRNPANMARAGPGLE